MYNIHVVRFFDFVPDPIKWVSVLNNKAELCVILKGNFPNFFFIGRGWGQGTKVVIIIQLMYRDT